MKTSPLHEHHDETRLAHASDRARPMVEGAAQAMPSSSDTEAFFDIEHSAAAGSMPPSTDEEELAPALLLDKLGERLAFERTGVRLYDGALLELDASGGFYDGPSHEDLEHIRAQELEHFGLLEEAIGELGGDPTAVTPSANLVATETEGVVGVIADPRAGLPELLHALLVAELTDNAGWEQLIDVCRRSGQRDWAKQFSRCCREEVEHLESLRTWLLALSNMQLQQQPHA
jgi:rubrerythrin